MDTQEGTDGTDNTGLVDMGAHENTSLRVNVHTELVDTYDTSLTAKERTLYRQCLAAANISLHRNEVGKVFGLFLLDFGYLNATALGQPRCIDVIYIILHDGIQQAFNHRRGQHAGINFRNLTVISNFHLLDRCLSQRCHRAAQTFSQRQVRCDNLHYLR